MPCFDPCLGCHKSEVMYCPTQTFVETTFSENKDRIESNQNNQYEFSPIIPPSDVNPNFDFTNVSSPSSSSQQIIDSILYSSIGL